MNPVNPDHDALPEFDDDKISGAMVWSFLDSKIREDEKEILRLVTERSNQEMMRSEKLFREKAGYNVVLRRMKQELRIQQMGVEAVKEFDGYMFMMIMVPLSEADIASPHDANQRKRMMSAFFTLDPLTDMIDNVLLSDDIEGPATVQ